MTLPISILSRDISFFRFCDSKQIPAIELSIKLRINSLLLTCRYKHPQKQSYCHWDIICLPTLLTYYCARISKSLGISPAPLSANKFTLTSIYPVFIFSGWIWD